MDRLWHVLLDLASTLRVPWTLLGGQMVLLHALEHGQVPPQISQDGDPFALVEQTTKSDRRKLSRGGQLFSETDSAWALVPDQIRAQGQVAYRVLTGN